MGDYRQGGVPIPSKRWNKECQKQEILYLTSRLLLNLLMMRAYRDMYCNVYFVATGLLAAPCMPTNAGWRWKADEHQHPTGSSTSKSSPLEGFTEQ